MLAAGNTNTTLLAHKPDKQNCFPEPLATLLALQGQNVYYGALAALYTATARELQGESAPACRAAARGSEWNLLGGAVGGTGPVDSIEAVACWQQDVRCQCGQQESNAWRSPVG
jgi:hypothetical protein